MDPDESENSKEIDVNDISENVENDDPLLARFLRNAKALSITQENLDGYIEKCYDRYDRQQRKIQDQKEKDKEHTLRMAQEETKRIEIEFQSKLRLKELEEQTKQKAIELDIQKQRDMLKENDTDSNNDNPFHSKEKFPNLKNFNEKTQKIEDYIHRFQHIAERAKWKKEDWAFKLSCYLEDDALSLYHDFTQKDSRVDWEEFKTELLKHYQCTSEGFRKKFRDLKPETNESFNKYKSTMLRYFERWLSLSGLPDTREGILNLFLGEQLLDICAPEIASDIRHKEITDFSEMIMAAESYRLAYPDKNVTKRANKSLFSSSNSCEQAFIRSESHNNDTYNDHAFVDTNTVYGHYQASQYQNPNHTYQYSNQNQNFRGRGNGSRRPYVSQNLRQSNDFSQRDQLQNQYLENEKVHSNYFTSQRGRANFQKRGSQNFSSRGSQQGNGQIFASSEKCLLCKGIGHSPSQCLLRNSRNPCSVCGIGGHRRKDCPFVLMDENGSYNPSGSACTGKTAIVCSVEVGKLHFENGEVNNTVCSILRDTGATICGIRKRLVRPDQYVPGVVACKTFGGEIHSYPQAKVTVSSPYFSGELTCCVLEDPVADVIIGNIPQVMKSASCSSNASNPCASVSTRAQTRASKIPQKPLLDVAKELNVSKKDLSKWQKEDDSIKNCFKMESSGEKKSIGSNTIYFFEKDNILYRHFENDKESFDQIVVPIQLRPFVLTTAHDQLLAGHCGVRKTQQRILYKFFWPGLSSDVTKYVRTCDICQKTTPKGRIPPVPLASMPLIGTPFDRVAIDLVGPIKPPSSQGHQYILTLIDIATRYPEAVALKDISTNSVIEALLSIFSRLGFPKEILSDNGPQFTSELMSEFQSMCGSKGIKTSIYHPQSNGHIERFHSTLKSKMKKVIREQPKAWHRYLPALMFACRDLPSETTGYSPFELMFGRRPRGPIDLLADSWVDDEKNDVEGGKPLYAYLFELKNIIKDSCEIAMKNSDDSSKRSKKYFDKKSKQRSFSEGDEVLVLLPTTANKLLMSWAGPYRIVQCFHPDYKVLVGSKAKIFHANMLKKYFRREGNTIETINVSQGLTIPWDLITISHLPEPNEMMNEPSQFNENYHNQKCSSSSCVSSSTKNIGIIQEENDSLKSLPLPMTSSMSDEDINMIDFNKDLSNSEHDILYGIYKEFEGNLTTKPGCFNADLMLDIKLTSDTCVRRKAYDLPFSSKQIVEREIQIMLDLGVIEKSKSSFSSAVVLVKKPDGSCRFCIDFRPLNKIIQFDAEPIPDVDELFTRIADSKYFTRIDLSKGYWQILVNPVDRHKTAFATHLGLYQWVSMPFGLVSAPACFARMMRFLQLEEHSAMNFFDDILIHSRTFKDHTEHLRGVLEKLKQYNLTAKPSKIATGYRSLEFLGHIVGQGLLKPEEKKVKKILAIPTPTTKKQVRSLMGLLGFYRRYIPAFASLTAPISDLTKDPKVRTITWTPACDEALAKIKQIFSISPVLQLPRLDNIFILRTDASSTGLGAVLLQEVESVLHPVSFASRKLLDRECRYSTIERECLAIVWGISKFSKFLWGTQFILQTDHRPLTFLQTSRFKNSRIMRWSLSLQEYKFDVQPVPGTQNIFADLLSRSNHDQMVP